MQTKMIESNAILQRHVFLFAPIQPCLLSANMEHFVGHHLSKCYDGVKMNHIRSSGMKMAYSFALKFLNSGFYSCLDVYSIL